MRRSVKNGVPYQEEEGPEVQRARLHGRKVRTLLDETFMRARKLEGKDPHPQRQGEPGGGTGGDGRWTAVLLRWWMIVLGLALIVVGLISAVVRINESVAINGPPEQGVVPSDLVVETCEDAARQVSQPPAEPVTEHPANLLNPERAEDLADEILARHSNLAGVNVPVLASGPELLQATLPDGTRQLVWARVWVPNAGGGQGAAGQPTVEPGAATPTPDPSTLGEAIVETAAPAAAASALVLYQEPVSGRPLVLYEGVTIQRPLLAGCEETFIGEVFESLDDLFAIRPETLGTLVVFVVGIVTLAYWQRMSAARLPRDPAKAARRAPVDTKE
jgi:hypothetical protein